MAWIVRVAETAESEYVESHERRIVIELHWVVAILWRVHDKFNNQWRYEQDRMRHAYTPA